MIRIERTRAPHLVKQILTHPSIWPHIGDDSTEKPDDFEPRMGPDVYRLVGYDEAGIGALFDFYPYTGLMFEGHVATLPHWRGRKALEAGRLALDWIWRNTERRKVMTMIAGDLPAARWYVGRLGFKKVGVLTGAIQRNGAVLDMHIFGKDRDG